MHINNEDIQKYAEGELKEDLKLSTEEGDQDFVNRLKLAFENSTHTGNVIMITTVKAMGQEKISDFKENN